MKTIFEYSNTATEPSRMEISRKDNEKIVLSKTVFGGDVIKAKKSFTINENELAEIARFYLYECLAGVCEDVEAKAGKPHDIENIVKIVDKNFNSAFSDKPARNLFAREFSLKNGIDPAYSDSIDTVCLTCKFGEKTCDSCPVRITYDIVTKKY